MKMVKVYIEDILEDLKIYEENRNEYKTFDEFYPMIVNHLIEKAKDHYFVGVRNWINGKHSYWRS